MYGAVEESSGWELDRVNLTSAALSEVGPMNGPNGLEDLDLAFDYSTDTLYALSRDGSLYTVNTSTGAATMALPVMSGSTQLDEIAGFTIDSTGGCRPPPECKQAATCPPPPPKEKFEAAIPPPLSCVVPKLKGRTLRRAKAALKAANCSLGKVRKPKHANGKLVVKSSSPGPGGPLPLGTAVNLKLKNATRARAR